MAVSRLDEGMVIVYKMKITKKAVGNELA